MPLFGPDGAGPSRALVVATVCLMAATGTAQGTDPGAPRLRTETEAGSVVWVEHMPDAKEVVVSLWASSRDVAETPTTHGHRHLMEHLLARGDGQLDRRLESEGITLTAQTFRFAMHFQFRCPPGKEGRAFQEIAGLLRNFEPTKERIEHELRIMRHEFALRDGAEALAAAAWRAAFGQRGLDAWGTLTAMGGATPESLKALHRAHFAEPNLAMVVAGPVDLDSTTAQVVALLATAPKPSQRVASEPLVGEPSRVEDEACFGEARAAITQGFGRDETHWALAAALALATEVPRSFVSFVPSAEPAVVTWGRDDQRHGLGVIADGLSPNDEARLFRTGWELGQAWYANQLRSPAGVAYLRGLYAVQSRGAKPEDSVRKIQAMTFEQFKQGLRAFGKDRGVTVVGVGR